MEAIDRAKIWIGESSGKLAEGMNTIIIIRGLLAEITRLESELAEARLIISGKTFFDERQAAAAECVEIAEEWGETSTASTIRKKFNI